MSLPRLTDGTTRRRMWEKTILATAASPGATYKPSRAAHAEPLRPGLEMSDELARGGMGVVFRATQTSLGRDVAVKKIRPDRADPEAEGLFLAEARVTGMLDHPNIVPVHELGRTPEGELFLAMKLVGGAPWKPARFDLQQNLEVLLAVSNAVAFAHSRGIAHCDLKPDNVMVGEFGEVLVMDWGLAVRFGEGGGDPAGTPAYMAPEQAEGRGADIGPSTDTYLLGGLLHAVLTGRPPHEGKDLYEVLQAAIESKPPDLPGELGAVCAKALSPERYASVAEFQRAIREYVKHRESRAIEEAAARTLERGEFADAIAGFRQAQVLWDGNADAREGEHRAREAYARAALAAGDLALAESQAESGPLREEIAAARRVRDRAARTAKIARRGLAAAAALIVVGATVGYAAIDRERTRTQSERDRADQEKAAALEMMRDTARIAVESALLLRRQGLDEHIRVPLPALEKAYARALERAPELAEVEYLMGRMHRALMDDERALFYQERALAKEPDYAPALYERAVLNSKKYGAEMRRAYASLLGMQTANPTLDDVEAARPELVKLREVVGRDIERLGETPAARGILAYHRVRYEEARRLLAEAAEQEPLLEEVWETLGQAANARAYDAGASEEKLRFWSEAERAYTQGHAHDRGYLPHLLGRGDVRHNRGLHRRNRGEDPLADYEAAEADFTEALRLNRELAEAWESRGMVRNNRGLHRMNRGEDPLADWEAAEADDTEALRLDGGYAEAWIGRGLVRNNRGGYRQSRGEDPLADYEAAEADFTEALRLNRELAKAWMMRAMVGNNRGLYRQHRSEDPLADYETAEADYTEALRLNPQSVDAWTRRGLLRNNRGVYRENRGEDPSADHEAAEADFTEALRLNREHVEAWMRRGMVRSNRASHRRNRSEDPLADFEAGEADFTEALRLNPRSAEAWMRRGMVRTNRGNYLDGRGESPLADWEEAEADLTEALRLNPRSAETWMRRGDLRWNRALWRERMRQQPGAARDYAAIADDYEQALDLNAALESSIGTRLAEARRMASEGADD